MVGFSTIVLDVYSQSDANLCVNRINGNCTSVSRDERSTIILDFGRWNLHVDWHISTLFNVTNNFLGRTIYD
jgi:hypothetical protein